MYVCTSSYTSCQLLTWMEIVQYVCCTTVEIDRCQATLFVGWWRRLGATFTSRTRTGATRTRRATRCEILPKTFFFLSGGNCIVKSTGVDCRGDGRGGDGQGQGQGAHAAHLLLRPPHHVQVSNFFYRLHNVCFSTCRITSMSISYLQYISFWMCLRHIPLCPFF